MMNYLLIDKIIKDAINEDIPFGDITTNSIVKDDSLATASLILKENGVICGLPIFNRVFEILGNVEFFLFVNEGDYLKKGKRIGILKGNAQNILLGERVALNLLQRMSGIATMTKSFITKIEDLNTKILDTRKTTPNLRILEKYAVKIGGGENHRFSLSDSILIKDNHIGYVGSITKAIELAKSTSSFVRKIEVETETKEDVLEALKSGTDIIMLDNMPVEMVKDMIKLINNKALTECSGNINLNTIRQYAETGVDYISIGSLTHSFNVLDISLKDFKPI